jgi:hypothetical protein
MNDFTKLLGFICILFISLIYVIKNNLTRMNEKVEDLSRVIEKFNTNELI